MNKRLLLIVGSILAVVVIGVLVFSAIGGSKVDNGNSVGNDIEFTESKVSGDFVKGDKAPEFTLYDFEGNSYTNSNFSEKALVLDFWAGWCPFCVEEMPELQAAQDKYSDNLQIIGVHRTDTEDAETGLKFARKREVSYLLVNDKSGQLYQASGGVGMPVAVFIDENGIVTDIVSGPKTKEVVKEKTERLVD